MKARWLHEKELIGKVRSVKESIEKARHDLEQATREGKFEQAGQIKYDQLPKLERELAAAQDGFTAAQKGGGYLKE